MTKMDQEDTLYIIGNGFDINHKLDTSYESFARFLKSGQYEELYWSFHRYIGFPDIDDEESEAASNMPWAKFEENLAFLDFEEVLDGFSDYGTDPTDYRDEAAFSIEIDRFIGGLTVGLRDALREFILKVDYSDNPNRKLLTLNKGFFLNLNYTDTLERFYKIQESRILYIHGKATKASELIIGHGRNPSELIPIEENESQPEGLDEFELEQWIDYKSAQFNPSYDQGKYSLKEYYEKSRKFSDEIILNNCSFFNSLDSIKKVIVIGHSLNDVDSPYYKKIIDVLTHDVKWEVSFHNFKDCTLHKQKLITWGVKEANITMFHL